MYKQLVIARYKENIEWLSNVSINNIIVYNKSDEKPTITNSNIMLKNIPNVGREAQTWTHHIINNWKNLADITMFIQADPFEHTEDLYTRLEYDYVKPTPLTVRYMKEWPGPEVTAYDLVYKLQDVEIRFGDIRFFGHRNRYITREWFVSIWSEIFNCPAPKVYYYGYAAMWAVPKDFILARGLEFWKNLNSKLQHNQPAYEQFDGWAMEALWNAAFSKPEVYPSIK